MLPDAFALERLVIRFHHAVLLRSVRVDELLAEARGRHQPEGKS